MTSMMTSTSDNPTTKGSSMGCWGSGFLFLSPSSSSLDRKDNNISLVMKNNKETKNSSSSRSSTTNATDETTDTLLAQSWIQLSTQERNHLLEDLHGVADIPQETQEFVKENLLRLQEELEKILKMTMTHTIVKNDNFSSNTTTAITSTTAYQMAKSINPSYVLDPLFLLSFLRADLYHPQNAAVRILKYFEIQLALFGKDQFAQPISALKQSFSNEETYYLDQGFFQCLGRDQTGRAIMASKSVLASQVPWETRRRLVWYLYNTAAQDETTQLKGAVVILDAMGLQPCQDARPSLDQFPKFLQALPIRVGAVHVCYDSATMHPLVQLGVWLMPQHQRCRLRFHYGSRMECSYKLMTFGIPKQAFPIDEPKSSDNEYCKLYQNNSNHNHSNNHDPVATIPKIEESSSSNVKVNDFSKQGLVVENEDPPASSTVFSSPRARLQGREGGVGELIIVNPTDMDIFMGRGINNKVQPNPGTLFYKQLLLEYRQEYDSLPFFEKVIVTGHVLQKIKQQGGRFLKSAPVSSGTRGRKASASCCNGGAWTEIDDNQALKKIGHAFRNLRKYDTPSSSLSL